MKVVAVRERWAWHDGRAQALQAIELARRGALIYTRAAELLGVSQAEFISYPGAHRVSICRFAPGELCDEVGTREIGELALDNHPQR